MKFSEFFNQKQSRADIEREAQEELEQLMARSHPPTESERTWVLQQDDVPDFRQAAASPPSPVAPPPPPRRRAVRPLLGSQAPPFPPPVERPAPTPPSSGPGDDFDDVPFDFDDDVPLDQVPLHSVFDDSPRASRGVWPASPDAPFAESDAGPEPEPESAPRRRPARPRPPGASGAGANAASPRPPLRRRPPA